MYLIRSICFLVLVGLMIGCSSTNQLPKYNNEKNNFIDLKNNYSFIKMKGYSLTHITQLEGPLKKMFLKIGTDHPFVLYNKKESIYILVELNLNMNKDKGLGYLFKNEDEDIEKKLNKFLKEKWLDANNVKLYEEKNFKYIFFDLTAQVFESYVGLANSEDISSNGSALTSNLLMIAPRTKKVKAQKDFQSFIKSIQLNIKK